VTLKGAEVTANLQQVIFVPRDLVKNKRKMQRVLNAMTAWAEKEYDVVLA
jgi:type III secretory pathway component EscV